MLICLSSSFSACLYLAYFVAGVVGAEISILDISLRLRAKGWVSFQHWRSASEICEFRVCALLFGDWNALASSFVLLVGGIGRCSPVATCGLSITKVWIANIQVRI